MLSKFVTLAAAVILAAPICAATGGSTPAGGSSTPTAAGGNSGGGAAHGGSGGGANGSVGRSGGLSGRAAAATARGVGEGRELSSHAGISPTDAMHATHPAVGKLSEGEPRTAKSRRTDDHEHDNQHHRIFREPNYGIRSCENNVYLRSWDDCNSPTKSLPHKS
jgi:hypothetical protein